MLISENVGKRGIFVYIERNLAKLSIFLYIEIGTFGSLKTEKWESREYRVPKSNLMTRYARIVSRHDNAQETYSEILETLKGMEHGQSSKNIVYEQYRYITTHFKGIEVMGEEKERIILKPNKKAKKSGFWIISGGIRTDGKYYEAILFLKTTIKKRKGEAWAVRLIANDLEVLKRMIEDYRCLYQMEREIELNWIKCDKVLTF